MNEFERLHDKNKIDWRTAREFKGQLQCAQLKTLKDHGFPWVVITMTVRDMSALLEHIAQN